jgi:hypothetical protein
MPLPRFDFCLLHAPGEAPLAAALHAALAERWRVFHAGSSLTPGDDAPTAGRRALQDAAVCVVLLARDTWDDDGLRSDVVAAIECARGDPAGHFVVPVLLDAGARAALPQSGLNQKHAIDVGAAPTTIARALHLLAEQLGLRDLEHARVNAVVLAVSAELAATAEAVAQRLRSHTRLKEGVEVLDAAQAEAAASLHAADLVVVLLGARTGGTDLLRAALDDAQRTVAVKLDPVPGADDVPDDEHGAARALRRRVGATFRDTESAVARVTRLVGDWERARFPVRAGRGAAAESWELEYLRACRPAWELGRFSALTALAGQRDLTRARLYVPLRAQVVPWCHLDPRGKLIVGCGDAPRARDPEPALRQEREIAPAFLEQALSHRELPFLVLQGEAGSGKTVLLQHVAYVLALRHLGEAVPEHVLDLEALDAGAPLPRIPVFLEARRLAEAMVKPLPGQDGLVTALVAAFGNVHVPAPEELLANLSAGRYLLLVDALDEVPDAAGRDAVVQALAGLAARRECRTRAVLTTRPAAHTQTRIPAALRLLPLAPLQRDRVAALIERWCDTRARAPHERAELHAVPAQVRDRLGAPALLENPLLLTGLLLVYENEGQLPDHVASLYNGLVNILCRLRRLDPWTPDDLRHALERVFHEMQRRGGTEHPVAPLTGVLKGWRPDSLATLDDARNLLDGLGAQTNLLRFENAAGPGGVVEVRARPWHRSFQEYLAACHLAADAGSVKDATARLCRPDGAHKAVVEDPQWEGTLTFLVGAHGQRGEDRPMAYVEQLLEQARGAWRDTPREGRVLGLAATGVADYPRWFERPTLRERVRATLAERFAACGAAWPWRDRVLALEALGRLGDLRLEGDPWVAIEGGTYPMGGDEEAYGAGPPRRVELAPFRIGRWPVTVAEYRAFADAADYADERWWRGLREQEGFEAWSEPADWSVQKRHPNRPVVGVSWWEAMAYARWRSARTAQPGEAAARP